MKKLSFPTLIFLFFCHFLNCSCSKTNNHQDKHSGDLNSNTAIRSDIERWISKQDISDETKRVLTLLAVAEQEVLTIELNQESAYKQAQKQMAYEECYLNKCIVDKEKTMSKDEAIHFCTETSQELNSLNFNTEARIRKYIEFDSYLRGRVIVAPKEACQ